MKIKIILLSVIVVITFIHLDMPKRFYYKAKRLGWLDKKLPLDSIDKDAVIILIAGQSNAANSGEKRYTPKHTGKVLNYYDGELYHAADPLLGADGTGGSPWGILGDMLIDAGRSQVVLVPIAQSTTTVSSWAGGKRQTILKSTLSQLQKDSIKLTHVFWQQGESDIGRSVFYKEQLEGVIKIIRHYQSCPVYIATATYNVKATSLPGGVDTSLRKVQQSFTGENIFQGPDADSLSGAIHRYDGQHFSEYGLKELAKAWYEKVFINGEPKP